MSKSNDKRLEKKLQMQPSGTYAKKHVKKKPRSVGGVTNSWEIQTASMSQVRLESAIHEFLSAIGEDPTRPGLRDTPRRVAKAWLECWGAGYEKKSVEDLITLFPDVEYFDTQMVTVKDISFHSHCEHHLAAFSGRAHISYVPSKKGVIGLSKLARVTDYFSRKLQTQERLTNEIADFLGTHLSKHVAVTLEATHGCMVSRGVMQPNALTITTALRGDYKKDPMMRTEFYDAIGR